MSLTCGHPLNGRPRADERNDRDTVAIESSVIGPVTVTTSGLTFTGAGTGMEDIGTRGRATGQPVITLEGVADVTISHLTIVHIAGDDGIDVDGASGITLDGRRCRPTAAGNRGRFRRMLWVVPHFSAQPTAFVAGWWPSGDRPALRNWLAI
jgi:hypothetical protein